MGELLRRWRGVRGLSQLGLALEASTTPRHVSFVESGRSQPSRAMVLRLARVLDVPIRERNQLLLAAGYAPLYGEAGLDGDQAAQVRAALERMLAAHEPFPAVTMDRHWNVTGGNGAASRFFGWLLGPREATTGPANVVRMMFDSRALRPMVSNWEAVAASLIGRVHREVVGGMPDADAAALVDEVLAYADVPGDLRRPRPDLAALPVIPIGFEKDGKRFRYFSTVTTLGTPQDVTAQELRIECFFPVDAETERNAAELARMLPGR